MPNLKSAAMRRFFVPAIGRLALELAKSDLAHEPGTRGQARKRLPVPFDEITEVVWHTLSVHVTAQLNFGRDLRGDVLHPVLERVEANDTNRITEAAEHHF